MRTLNCLWEFGSRSRNLFIWMSSEVSLLLPVRYIPSSPSALYVCDGYGNDTFMQSGPSLFCLSLRKLAILLTRSRSVTFGRVFKRFPLVWFERSGTRSGSVFLSAYPSSNVGGGWGGREKDNSWTRRERRPSGFQRGHMQQLWSVCLSFQHLQRWCEFMKAKNPVDGGGCRDFYQHLELLLQTPHLASLLVYKSFFDGHKSVCQTVLRPTPSLLPALWIPVDMRSVEQRYRWLKFIRTTPHAVCGGTSYLTPSHSVNVCEKVLVWKSSQCGLSLQVRLLDQWLGTESVRTNHRGGSDVGGA